MIMSDDGYIVVTSNKHNNNKTIQYRDNRLIK